MIANMPLSLDFTISDNQRTKLTLTTVKVILMFMNVIKNILYGCLDSKKIRKGGYGLNNIFNNIYHKYINSGKGMVKA